MVDADPASKALMTRTIPIRLTAATIAGAMATGLALAQSAGPPRIVPKPLAPGANCRPSCATVCDRISCDGLNVSQCMGVRLKCRTQCRSRC